jgi:hypothetical protein
MYNPETDFYDDEIDHLPLPDSFWDMQGTEIVKDKTIFHELISENCYMVFTDQDGNEGARVTQLCLHHNLAVIAYLLTPEGDIKILSYHMIKGEDDIAPDDLSGLDTNNTPPIEWW